jgi:hypothetical protein
MDEHYSLIMDHIAMIHSQQEGQNMLAASGVAGAGAATDLEVEEWSSGEEGEEDEGGGGRMEV